MIQNAYFENLGRLGKEHAEQCKAHEALKGSIIEAHGWDSPELEAWYTEKKRLEDSNPVAGGIGKAFRAWYWGTTEELEMDEFLWEREAEDFIETLRKAGFQSFVYTNQSTAVMQNIHQFVAAGCTLEGPCTITKKRDRWGEETEEQVLGLRFRL